MRMQQDEEWRRRKGSDCTDEEKKRTDNGTTAKFSKRFYISISSIQILSLRFMKNTKVNLIGKLVRWAF